MLKNGVGKCKDDTLLGSVEGCSYYFEIGFMESNHIHPPKSFDASIHQNLARRLGIALQTG